jgi:hypothetical protein
MKQDYTLYIYKADRRKKTGERLFSTTVWTGQDDNGMRRTVADLFDPYPPSKGYRFEWFPTTKTVKNLMTGLDVVRLLTTRLEAAIQVQNFTGACRFWLTVLLHCAIIYTYKR